MRGIGRARARAPLEDIATQRPSQWHPDTRQLRAPQSDRMPAAKVEGGVNNSIVCPKCRTEIEITEVISAQLESRIRTQLESDYEPRRRELEAKSAALRKAEDEVKRSREALRDEVDGQVREKLTAERKKVLDEAKAKAVADLSLEMRDKEEQIKQISGKLQEAKQAELTLRQRERELEARAQDIELTLARKLDEQRQAVFEEVRKRADDEQALKLAEKEKTIADLLGKVEEMRRKAEQGSQQMQGEVLEVALERQLREAFPQDTIEEVPKGVAGGDIVQRVIVGGLDCGTILWETKRTKSWSDAWLPKLRANQREARAALAILVSSTMPTGVEPFARIDDVWVTNWACAVNVASALRVGLLEVAKARRALQGQQGKMEQVYEYVSSAAFRSRVSGVVEALAAMRSDLEAEKRAIAKQWAKREKQIEQAVLGTAAMYGDFQGVVGAALPEIAALQLPLGEVSSV